MIFHLVPTDCVGPRPAPQLPWGTFACCCALCGEAVFIQPPDEPPSREPGHIAITFPVHPKCQEMASPKYEAALMGLALKQRTWEARAQLN